MCKFISPFISNQACRILIPDRTDGAGRLSTSTMLESTKQSKITRLVPMPPLDIPPRYPLDPPFTPSTFACSFGNALAEPKPADQRSKTIIIIIIIIIIIMLVH